MIRALLICLILIAGPARAEQLTVFAAASLFDALEAVNHGYPGKVRTAFGSSASLARQVAQGAPADVIISANPAWMDWLEARRAIRAESRTDLLTNRLVVVGRSQTLQALADLPSALDGGRLALGLTEAVPAGIYAAEALKSAGIWEALKPNLAEADNVRMAVSLVARGEAPFGIVYATDALAFSDVQTVLPIDPSLHAPIVYPLAAVAGSDNSALNYIAYLKSDAARAVFEAHGFGWAAP